MRTLILLRIDSDRFESQAPLPDALHAEMGALIGRWSEEGTLVSAEGLRPTSEGRRLRIGSSKLVESDGPFTEAKEVIGGFFIIRTETKAQAIAHTRELLELHSRVLGDDFVLECELRQLEDAPAEG
jgi:hypothetical protein